MLSRFEHGRVAEAMGHSPGKRVAPRACGGEYARIEGAGWWILGPVERCVCGEPAAGWVEATEATPAHVCRQCGPEHCLLARLYRLMLRSREHRP